MPNINIVQVCGRLTQRPEAKTTQGGMVVCNFSVATNRIYYKGQEGAKEKVSEVEFHNVVVFGKTAETIAKWFDKGDEIYIQGRLKTSSWMDQQTQVKKWKTDIMAEKFDFGQKSKNSVAPNDSAQQPAQSGYDGSQPAPQNDYSQPTAGSSEEEIKVENIPF